MHKIQPLKLLCVCLASAGMILPGNVLGAGQPRGGKVSRATARRAAPLLGDVELGSRGTLHGVVVNVQGVPIAGATVVVRRGDRELGRTSTDELGRFAVEDLRGGVYQLTVRRSAKLVRAWAPCTAPPGAGKFALVVAGGDVVRGQVPLGEFLSSNSVLITGIVAAMIAIPIAVHQSGHRTPNSP